MDLKVFSFTLAVHTLFLLLSCTSSKNSKCDQFKAGNFEYHSNGMLYAITREDTVQTELNKLNGDITQNSIKWISDCTYELRLLESTAVYPDSIKELRMASTLTVEIVSFTDLYYIYQSKSDVADRVMTDTLWVRE
jgi:hypothetical protein